MLFTAKFGQASVFFLMLASFSGISAFAAKPVSDTAQWLQVRIGPDSNACGITAPVNRHHQVLPVVLWLHGGMRSANREKGFSAHRYALELVSRDSAYFLSPSAYGGSDWLSEAGMRHIDGCIEYVQNHFPVKKSPIWGIGVSDGTLGIIRYTLLGHYPLQRRLLVSTYPELALPAKEVAGQPLLAKGVWEVFVGGQDRLFPSQPVLEAGQAWSRQLPNFHLHFDPQGEHDMSWWMEHQKPQLKAALLGR